MVCINYEGITNFVSLTDFDNKIIESLPTNFKEKITAITDYPSADITAAPAVPGANIYSIAVSQLIVAIQAVRYYTSTDITTDATYMHDGNLLSSFNIEWDIHEKLKKENYPNEQVINDKENDFKVIKWLSTLLTVSLEPIDQEDLWFMCSDNQVLFQVSSVIPWTSTHTMEQVLVFMSNG